jgi:hypothetical protein
MTTQEWKSGGNQRTEKEIRETWQYLNNLISGLAHSDSEFARQIITDITNDIQKFGSNKLENNIHALKGALTEKPSSTQFSHANVKPSNKLASIEETIIQILNAENSELALGDILERLVDSGEKIDKGTLSVRLHRMFTRGLLRKPNHGNYVVADNIHDRNTA